MMRDDVCISWQSPLDVMPTLNRHYLVADGVSSVPSIVSGTQLMTGLADAFCVAELPDAPICMREAVVARPQTHASCPWCPPGRQNLINRPSVDGHYVNCLECGATGPYAPSRIEAWVKWDVRKGGRS